MQMTLSRKSFNRGRAALVYKRVIIARGSSESLLVEASFVLSHVTSRRVFSQRKIPLQIKLRLPSCS